MSAALHSRRNVLACLLSVTTARTVALLAWPALLTAAELALADEHGSAMHGAHAALATLSAEVAVELDAIAARIVPTDSTPGAREAGVIYFMDRVLGSSRSELLEPVLTGLASLHAAALEQHGKARFSLLEAAQQDALLQTIEKTEFFETLRFLTLAGMFALPEYGGNKEFQGWDLLGFDHRHVWQPPFGYYDADYIERGE